MNSKLVIGVLTAAVIIAGIFLYLKIKPSNEIVLPPDDLLDQELNFETISKEVYGGHDDKKEYVIKDSAEWSNLWNVIYSKKSTKPDLPTINFDEAMIIAVFQGSYGTGGYSIEITKITEQDNAIEVLVKEKSPSSGSMKTQAFTQPYHIVKTKRSDKEVVFIR